MQLEQHDVFVFPEMTSRGFRQRLYISDLDDKGIDEVIAVWGTGDENSIAFLFRLDAVLDSAIDLHEMPGYGYAIDIEAKPLFEAMRAEAAAMVSRIDALTFASAGASPTQATDAIEE